MPVAAGGYKEKDPTIPRLPQKAHHIRTIIVSFHTKSTSSTIHTLPTTIRIGMWQRTTILDSRPKPQENYTLKTIFMSLRWMHLLLHYFFSLGFAFKRHRLRRILAHTALPHGCEPGKKNILDFFFVQQQRGGSSLYRSQVWTSGQKRKETNAVPKNYYKFAIQKGSEMCKHTPHSKAKQKMKNIRKKKQAGADGFTLPFLDILLLNESNFVTCDRNTCTNTHTLHVKTYGWQKWNVAVNTENINKVVREKNHLRSSQINSCFFFSLLISFCILQFGWW